MASDETERSARIAQLNDRLRGAGKGGMILVTRGIKALGFDTIVQIMAAVQEFSEFTPDNDPHNEHDFGTVCFGEHTVNWKIDYYDPSLTFGSEDPADENKTCRLLTIMLQEEY